MTKKIHETHKYSKKFYYVKVLSNIIFGTILILITYNPIQSLINSFNFNSSIIKDLLIVGFFILIAVIDTLIHTFSINRFYDTLSTYFYMRNELETEISLADANYLKKIFEPAYIKSESWLTMQNIIKLPDNMRRKAAMDTAKKMLENRKK